MPTEYKILGQATPGSTRAFLLVSNKALTSNVATLTTSATHNLSVGDVVQVFGVDTVFDGTYVVASVPTTTTFTYPRTNANVTSAAVSPNGVAIRTHNLGGVAVSNKFATNGVVTLTTSASHGFAAHDLVRVTVADTNCDGAVKILAVPSATTFTYQLTSASVASTAVSSGAVGRTMPSTMTTLYQPQAGKSAVVSTVSVANTTNAQALYRIAVASTTTPVTNEWVVFDGIVPANDTAFVTVGMTIPALEYLLVSANAPDITFAAFGSELS